MENMRKIVCDKCGLRFKFESGDVLTTGDVFETFPKTYVKSVGCPRCGSRNVIEYKDINNKVVKL